ncbi:MAG: glycoside hydrolase family 20 zincin-like fold domain-containing protein, partial [Flavobacteriaceae bacterium]
MKQISNLLCLISILFFTHCEQQIETHLEQFPLIPIANVMEETGSAFFIKDKTVLYFDEQDEDLKQTAIQLKSNWEAQTNNSLSLNEGIPFLHSKIELIKSDFDKEEAYEINIDKKAIVIRASAASGFYRALTSLDQLLRFQKLSSNLNFLPTGVIQDAPKYSYRGAMLDVSRHFFTVEEVKQYIDLLALYKINH